MCRLTWRFSLFLLQKIHNVDVFMNALKDRGVLVGGVKGKINGSYCCMKYDALLSLIISKFGPINIPLSTFDAPLRAFNVTYARFCRTPESSTSIPRRACLTLLVRETSSLHGKSTNLSPSSLCQCKCFYLLYQVGLLTRAMLWMATERKHSLYYGRLFFISR